MINALSNKGDVDGDGTVNYITLLGDPGNVDAIQRTEYSIKALDEAGNKNVATTFSTELNIEADNQDPELTSIEVVSPEDGIYKKGQTIEFVATYDVDNNEIVPLNRAMNAVIESLVYYCRFDHKYKDKQDIIWTHMKELNRVCQKVGNEKEKKSMKLIIDKLKENHIYLE